MLKILMAASEAVPFAKTGGLADVLGSLPKALNKEGADVRVILPKYGSIPPLLKETILHQQTQYVKVSWKNQYCGIESAEYNGVIYYFLDNEYYFKREALYGFPDDAERYAFYCRAVLDALIALDFKPDIIHAHDWQAGMIPVLLEAQYRHMDFYKDIKTVFTIHNLKYQGNFSIALFQDLFSLEGSFFSADKLEFYGGASFLKGGLVYAHQLTTVSNTYAEEIQMPYFGEKLDGLLKVRNNSLTGILNGIDEGDYDPETDPLIYMNYTPDTLKDKITNKVGLQRELDLPVREDVPVIALVSRLVDQKGLDLIAHVLDEIITEDMQLLILGTGDQKYEELFRETARRFPQKVSANIKFDNVLAHRMYAGADMFLMPSLFEPCGLGQIISLRYGTLPIVRQTGGLKDTISSYNEGDKTGNGFSFTNYNAHDMLHTIRRALELYSDSDVWYELQQAAMACDFSWNHSAKEYMALYASLKG